MIGRRRKHAGSPLAEGLRGVARVDRRTKDLLVRLQPREIAVIDHEDIDRISAEGLIHRQAAAVVNAARSSTGRYPNLGPLLLCTAGIPLVDDAGPEVMQIPEASSLLVRDGRIYLSDGNGSMKEMARGRVLDTATVEKMLDSTKQSISVELERFAENTIEYMREERELLLEGVRLPDVKTDVHARHVLIVVRGHHYKDDLRALKPYIREMRPALVGVDGGADALIDAGLRPDIVIGDMDSVTTEALLSGAEVIVHAYPSGVAPGQERVEALGVRHSLFHAPGTSEDIAMLLAYERGAELIVAVGTHANLVEFLDKGRKGMASTFLTRLKVGPILVDAKGVSRLYRSRFRRRDLLLLVAAALVAMAAAVWLSEPMRLELELLWLQLKNAWYSLIRSL